jgi:hypothetical protein
MSLNQDGIIALTSPRVLTQNSWNVTEDQSKEPPAIKTDTLTIPSSSQPSFGSYFVVDFRERNCILNNLCLEFNVSTISDLSGTDAGYPRFSPVFFWFSRIEIVSSGQVLDTLYPTHQFIMNQITKTDLQRLSINVQGGHYGNDTQRNTLSTATNSWFLNLQCLLDQNNIPFLAQQHELQLRVYMNSVADLVSKGTLTGTPSATINYCNLLASIIRLDETTSYQQSMLMNKYPFDHIYHDLRQQIVNVNSGVSSTTVITSAIVGQVAAIMFVIRNVGSTTTDNAFAFNSITSFEILNSSSTNITGGQAVSRALSLLIQGKKNSLSSYFTEIDIGSTAYGATLNNTANVFIYSFSQDLPLALTHGKRLGAYPFQGNEQLKITFTASLSNDVQIDIYALTECRLFQSLSGFQKIPL